MARRESGGVEPPTWAHLSKSLMDIIAKLSQEHSVNAREQSPLPVFSRPHTSCLAKLGRATRAESPSTPHSHGRATDGYRKTAPVSTAPKAKHAVGAFACHRAPPSASEATLLPRPMVMPQRPHLRGHTPPSPLPPRANSAKPEPRPQRLRMRCVVPSAATAVTSPE